MKDNTIATKKQNFKFVNFDEQSLKEQAYHILDYLLSEPHQTLIPDARVELLKKTIGDWEPDIFGNKPLTENIDKVIDNFKLSFQKDQKDKPLPDSVASHFNDKLADLLSSQKDKKDKPLSEYRLRTVASHNANFELNRYELEDLKDLELFDDEHNPCKEIEINPCKEIHIPSQTHLPTFPKVDSADVKIREEWRVFKRRAFKRKHQSFPGQTK